VPRQVASILTYPERVTNINLAVMRKAVANGKVYPGARNVRLCNGSIISLEYADRNKAAKMLQVGDIVERHMVNGDIVLFNRQPSLHRMSIMCHRARVLDWRTFRFNEVCTGEHRRAACAGVGVRSWFGG
jgi:DNA-directed RNA polymerase III subunit RPC1